MPNLRPAAVAGTFYPGAPDHLLREVDRMLAAVALPPIEPAPKALIVPHAGFAYSGPVAASAYAQLTTASERIARVVLLGPSHRAPLYGLALPEADAFDTPLGAIAIDEAALASISGIVRSDAPHRNEHSLEVQLPFLARVTPRAKLVPLTVGDATAAEVAEVIEALWGGPETVVVVSSDLSHYLPYRLGRAVDEETARRILDLSATPIDHERACGATPVNGLLEIARRKRLHPTLLDLRSSGDTAGGRDEVVGYGAFAFYEPEPRLH